jgi:hypothetical protein
MPSPLSKIHAASLVTVSLVVGAMFGIWRGYDPATYSAMTFVEVHKGAVRGLNDLLPFMGLACIAMVVALAVLARKRPQVLWRYAAAALAVAGIVTRFGNQPINDIVMTWGATPPDGWQALRDTWWNWHLARLAAGFVGEVILISAIFADRSQSAAAAPARLPEPTASVPAS